MEVRRIPVTDHNGSRIGMANVDASGILTFILEPGSEVFGRKVVDLIREGALAGLTISFAARLPVPPTALQDPIVTEIDTPVWRDRANPNFKNLRF